MPRAPRAIRLAILIAAAATVPAHAFIYLKGSTYEKGERPVSEAPIWPTRTVSFLVNVDPAAMGGSLASSVSGTEMLAAAEAAVNAWADACRADIQVRILGTTSATYGSSDSRNVIVWDNRTTAEGNYYGTSTSTLAAATTVLRGTDFADCDIVLNGNSSTTMAYSPAVGEADLRSVLTHEIGHCLGLDHPIEPPDYTSTDPFITEATMVQTASTGLDPSDPGRRTINQDDRDGIECLYERGKPFRGGLHCDSYTGTNGQGALSGVVVGGPTVVDTVCGGDAQGRNAHPALDSGDGCVPAAVAATDRPPVGPEGRVGGSLGFLAGAALWLAYRAFRRRSLRRARAALIASLGIALAAATGARDARAVDVELGYGHRAVSPETWNAFAGMDPEATAWDRAPTETKLGSLSEIRVTAFSEFADWGKWGGSFSLMLPKSLETSAKAASASEQSKKTTLSGFRIGPDFRWFPAGAEGGVRWFVGGRFGLGLFYGSQTFVNSAESEVSYRAWASELALSTGAEIPLGALRLVVEGGYSRNRSSYFASTGSSGAGYSDFPSGTRLATNTGAGSEDVRFDGSGPFVAIALQMTIGSAEKAAAEPRYDDYEKPAERAPRPEPSAEPDAAAEPAPSPTPAPAPIPSSAPASRDDRAPDPVPDPFEGAKSPEPPKNPESFESEESAPSREPDPVPFMDKRGKENR